jgi:hypothetical protein
MVDVKSGPVNLALRPSKEMKTAVIVVSFKIKGDPITLKNIECGGASQGSHPDEMALCYGMYMNARDKIHKNFSEESKSKISHVHCAHQSDEFMIIAECDASLTTGRKCISGILRGLDPSACKSGYRAAIRSLDCSFSEDAYFAACHEAVSGLKNVKVFVGGKGFGSKNSDKAKIEESLKIAVSKFDPTCAAKGTARSVKANEKSAPQSDVYFMSKKGDSAAAVCAYLYLVSAIPGVSVMDDKIVVGKAMETQVSKLADKGDLIKKQVEKMLSLPEPSHSLAAVAGRYGLVSGSQLIEIADGKLSAGTATAAAKMF